jgi:hypothetical protein
MHGRKKPFRQKISREVRLGERNRNKGNLRLVGPDEPSRAVTLRDQLDEFGVDLCIIEKAMERIGDDGTAAYNALRNIHLLNSILLYEDVGGYISSRPHVITMATALLARSLGMDPERIRMRLPERLLHDIVPKRIIQPEPVIEKETRERLQRARQAKEEMVRLGLDQRSATLVMDHFSRNGFEPKILARNVVHLFECLPREEVFPILMERKDIRSLGMDELDDLIRQHEDEKLIRQVQELVPRMTIKRTTLREVARICSESQGVLELNERLEHLRAYAQDNSFSYEDFTMFVKSHLPAIASHRDKDRLAALFREEMDRKVRKSRISQSISRLQHAKKHRVRGMDKRKLHELISSCGFQIVGTKGGSGHMRAEYKGEIATDEKGWPILVMHKTSQDLAYGTAADILGKLIGYLKRKRKETGRS